MDIPLPNTRLTLSVDNVANYSADVWLCWDLNLVWVLECPSEAEAKSWLCVIRAELKTDDDGVEYVIVYWHRDCSTRFYADTRMQIFTARPIASLATLYVTNPELWIKS